MVYVQDINGKPMMPTTRHGKVRRLLKDKKAVVVNLCPFTIKLTYVTSDYKQEIVLGVDAGTRHVGLSATTKSKELYSSEVILRNDIVDLLSTRRALRRSRRGRLRYRKPRFNNRIKSKRPGWIAPSVQYKIDAHIRVIDNVCSILPISRIVIEVAQFDTQKINNPEISGKEYHKGNINLKVKRGKSLRDAAVMGIMKWRLYEGLKSKYDKVSMTFGYVTKYNRIYNNIEKSHVSDAFIISKNFNSIRLGYYYKVRLIRRYNRQIHKQKIPKVRLFDRVMFENSYYFIFGKRKTGRFNIRDIDGKNQRDIMHNKLKLSRCKRFMIQKEMN